MTSLVRLVIEFPPPAHRFLLRLREDFVDVLLADGYGVIEAIRIQADEAVGPDARDLPGNLNAVAFGNSLNHQPYLALGGAEAI